MLPGPGHLLFGSDWPFAARMYAPEGDPQPALGDVFSGARNSMPSSARARSSNSGT